MKIDTYRDVKNGAHYYSVPSGTDLNTLSSLFESKIGSSSLIPFKIQYEVTPGQSYVALDAQDIENQINSQGYAVHGVKMIWKELRGSLPQLTPTEELMAEKHAETEREEAKFDARL